MKLKTNYGHIPLNELKISEIPSTPKYKLSNYIKNMHHEEIDKKSSNLYVKINKFNKEILLPSILNKNYSHSQIIYWKAKSSPHKIQLPTHINPKLAYLIGYLYGDGGLKDIRRSYKISKRFEHKIIVGDEFETQIINIINPLFQQLFNLHTKIRYEKIKKGIKIYYINPTSKVIYRFLTNVFNFPEGPKKGKLKIPYLIKNSNKRIKLWFIKGLLDADGDVRAMEKFSDLNKKHKSPRIKLRMADKNFICEIKDLINQDFDLGFTGPYSDTGKDWYIQGAVGSLKKANKLNIFIHPIKKWRLSKLIKPFEENFN